MPPQAAGIRSSAPWQSRSIRQFFFVSADTLSNLNTKDPMVTTTGPSSINPTPAKPYGMSFPVIAMRDSVRVHKALVDSLGVAACRGGPPAAVRAGGGMGGAVSRLR